MKPYVASWQRKAEAKLQELQVAIAQRKGEEHKPITPQQRAEAIAARQAKQAAREAEMPRAEQEARQEQKAAAASGELAFMALALRVERPQPRRWRHEDQAAAPMLKIDGVRGEWLDENGFVRPEYREQAAEFRSRHRHDMVPLGVVMVMAQSRRE